MANLKAYNQSKIKNESETNPFANYQRVERQPVAAVSVKSEKIAKPEVKQKKKKVSTTPRTYKMLDVVIDSMEDRFHNERLARKGMNYQKYINDLVYRDTHNGQALYDYETGELLIDIN